MTGATQSDPVSTTSSSPNDTKLMSDANIQPSGDVSTIGYEPGATTQVLDSGKSRLDGPVETERTYIGSIQQIEKLGEALIQEIAAWGAHATLNYASQHILEGVTLALGHLKSKAT